MTAEPTPPSSRSWAATAAAGWRSLLFGGMALLCLHLSVVQVLRPAANPWWVGPLYVAGVLAAWYNPVWAVFGFVVAIPLVNGTAILWSEPSGNPWNVVFAGIFLAWFIKRAFVRKKGFEPPTRTAILIDILSTSVLCSLLILLLGYPRAEVFPAVFSEIVLNQYVLLYCVQAAAVLMQGLFLWRLLELEADTIGGHRSFARTLMIIAAIAMGFSLLQFVFDMPVWRGLVGKGKRGLFSPFDDIHSYGSTMVLLFSMMLVLTLGGRGRARAVSGAAALLLAACAVYSFSRTTWVALLFVVILSVWQLGRKQAIAITAAGLLMVVLALAVVQNRNFSIPGVPLSTKELSNTAILSVRFYQWNIAGAMIRDAPLSGVGIGSLLRLFPFYSRYDPTVDGVGPYAVRAPANAHNYFLQFAAELGLPALIVLFVLLLCAYRSAFARLASEPDARPLVKGLMVGVGGYLLSCVTGHPLLLPAQQFIFWFAVAALTIAPSRTQATPSPRFGRFAQVGLVVLGVVMIAGYGYRAQALSASPGYVYGLYPADTWGDEKIEWTNKDARLHLLAKSDLVDIRFIADRHNTIGGGLDLTIAVNGKELDQVTIFAPGPYRLSYYVPGITDQTVAVQLSVSRTFNPRRLGMSDDYRDLGVALASITFPPELAPEGVGFHEWERVQAGSLPPEIQENTRFRWTQRQASLPLRGRAPDAGLTLLLCANHPDIRTRPVSVEILADDRVLRTVTFNDAEWKPVGIPADMIRGARTLTLRVDRTWNPRRLRLSDDTRDIGVGVILR